MKLARLLASTLLLATDVFSSSVKSWDISDYDSFLPGSLESVALSREGQLRLAPRISDLHESDDAITWTAATAADGTIYLGTGHTGRLYRAAPDGVTELLWTAPEIEIFALAVAPNGDVYAGTSPSGKVYRVLPDGSASEFFNPGQEYIWQLQFGAVTEGGGFGGPDALYVGTGPSGEVYRVEADGRGEVWFDTQQRHITALSLDPEGRLLAAADPSGLLYRIDGKDQAFALYDSSLPEIRDIRVAADGSIYLAAMGGAISLSDSMVQTISAATTTISVTAVAGGTGTATPGAITPMATPQPVSTPAMAKLPIVNYGVETSALILLRPGERAETLWTSTQENALAISLTDDERGVLIATDQMGRVYRVDTQGRSELLAQTDEQQITSLIRSTRGLVMTAAHGSSTRLMVASQADSGRYETAPFDAGAISTWGRLDWRGTGAISLHTRSGNTARPDDTWSEWSPAVEGAGGGPVSSPAARYLQWAARFDSPNQTLDTVRTAYLPANAKPTLSAVTVSLDSDSPAQKASSTAAANPYTITVSANGSPNGAASASDSTALANSTAGKLKIAWAAVDLDGDDLVAKVEFRGEDETEWKLIEADVAGAFITLANESLADGRYRFRVTVSDRPDNPGESARTTDRTSSEVLIDHTPPTVEVTSTSATVAQFAAEDQASPIVEAHYSIDAARWIPLRSDDGLTDSLSESFTVPIGDLATGEHLITFRVRDQAGNAGLGKALVSSE